MTVRPIRLVDAHQHFWDPDAAHYPWMTGAYEPLRRVFSPSDLGPLLEASGVSGTIAVQARHDLSETRALLEHAAATDWILGVVGWVDLSRPDVGELIAQIREGPEGDLLVGIRHLVHDEADPDWLLRDDVLRGLSAVSDSGLVYDLLVRTRELPAATELARRLPELRLVVDHLAKPPIASQTMEPWASAIGTIAKLPNVTCKVSGLVTEADWTSWTATDLVPYVGTVVKLFGPDRLMWGSDWPVCTLAASYSQVLGVALEVLAEEVGDDLGSVLGRCASTIYGLEAQPDRP